MINWIQNWFSNQCDCNWEHENRIKIETIDNPGWNVEINFNYTNLKIQNINWEFYESSETKWIGFSINDNIFKGSGDSLRLNSIIKIFKLLSENEKMDEIKIKLILNE